MRARAAPMNALVLGLGNILLSDEGVGVRVTEILQARYIVPDGVEVVDGGTAGMDLFDLLSGRDHVLVLDAVSAGKAPATIVRLVGDEVPAFLRARLSPHQLGLCDVLALLKIMEAEPTGLTLLGIEPADLSVGLELSPAVAAKLDVLIEMTVSELKNLGFLMRLASHTATRPG